MWCVRTASRMRKIRNKHKVSDNVDNARAEQHCTPPKRHAQRYRETYIFVLHHTHQRDFSQRSLRKCVMLEGVGDLLNRDLVPVLCVLCGTYQSVRALPDPLPHLVTHVHLKRGALDHVLPLPWASHPAVWMQPSPPKDGGGADHPGSLYPRGSAGAAQMR